MITVEREYVISKVSNGWILTTGPVPLPTFVCDTLGEAIDQIDAEEKFPNGE